MQTATNLLWLTQLKEIRTQQAIDGFRTFKYAIFNQQYTKPINLQIHVGEFKQSLVICAQLKNHVGEKC